MVKLFPNSPSGGEKADQDDPITRLCQEGNIENKMAMTTLPVVKKKLLRGKKWLYVLLPLLFLFIGVGVMGGLTYRRFVSIGEHVRELQAKGEALKSSFEAQDFKAVFAGVEELAGPLAAIKDDYRAVNFWRPVPYLGRFYRDGESFLRAGDEGYQAALTAALALEPYQDLLIPPDGEGEVDGDEAMTVEERLVLMLDTLDLLEPQFDEIIGHLVAAQAAVEEVEPGRYPETLFGITVRARVSQVQSLLKNTTRSVEEVRPLVSYLKPLLGIPEKKTYFVLFQNDAELRPSGGFMTAYAYISVEKGKFEPLGSYDIYALDAQFGNRVKAPPPILEYLPNVSFWHLRDMNLSPDFVVSMETFWENYQKIPGAREVDGIIAVDTQVLVDLLQVLGPIGVSNWGNFSAEIDSRCNCPQVVYELERFADQPVSAIRDNRKGIIGPLMHSILSNMMGSPRQKWPEFLNLFFNNLAGKHVLFYFFDEELQGAVEKMNASGRIREAPADYFYLSDCNFGGAKSNLYIEQQVIQEVSVGEDGRLMKKVTIEYRNPFPGSNCNLEKGDLCLNALYRDWFRLYVPAGSELIEAKGSEVEIKTYEELGKTVFEGFYGFSPTTSLKPEGKLTLSFVYRLPFAKNDLKRYELLIQKQPGTKDHRYEVLFDGQTEELLLEADTELVFAY